MTDDWDDDDDEGVWMTAAWEDFVEDPDGELPPAVLPVQEPAWVPRWVLDRLRGRR